MKEADIIDALKDSMLQYQSDVLLPIGDDGAIIDLDHNKQMVTVTDAITADVHYPAGIEAEANREGTIYIDPSVPESRRKNTVDHEMVHIDQMRRGDLDYTNDTVTWKGKTVARQEIKEGESNLPWEQEAYAKVKKK